MKTLTYKYRLYPTSQQESTFLNVLDSCRNLYNCILEYKITTYRKTKKSFSKFDINKEITQLKRELPEYQNVHSQVLQDVSNRNYKSYQNTFRNLKRGIVGFPKFKSKRFYKSFTYPQGGFKFVDDKHLCLSKIGNVKIKLHREIKGKIKQLTIKQTNTGKWYACFSVECKRTRKCGSSSCGIDLGIEKFITFDNGDSIENPKFFKTFEKKIKKYQRKFSLSPRGSTKKRKYLKIINRLYEKTYNQKHNYFHHVTNELIEKNHTIYIENLNIKNMLKSKSKSLNKSINETSWNMFTNILKYKAEIANCKIVEVDPKFTSQRCSNCGDLVYKKLHVRQHVCQKCGLNIHRDHNAAINVKTLGIQCLENPQGFPRSPSL